MKEGRGVGTDSNFLILIMKQTGQFSDMNKQICYDRYENKN